MATEEGKFLTKAAKIGAHWAIHRDESVWKVSSLSCGMMACKAHDRETALVAFGRLEKLGGPLGDDDAQAWAKDHPELRSLTADCREEAFRRDFRKKRLAIRKDRASGLKAAAAWAKILRGETPIIVRETIDETRIVKASANGEQFTVKGDFAGGFYRGLCRAGLVP